jgi:C1A family cysteine protease
MGSCTGNALAGALEFLEIKAKTPYVDHSRLFIYYNERILDGSVNEDSGAYLRDGIKTLAKQGVCSESTWPYLESNLFLKPTNTAYNEAKQRMIKSYYRLNGLADFKNCLASGYPFVFGFLVYESFESNYVAKTGIVPMPKKREMLLGGHAVLAVGYSDNTQRFLIRNSWGIDWGYGGYFYLPYQYLANRNLASDFWTIRK